MSTAADVVSTEDVAGMDMLVGEYYPCQFPEEYDGQPVFQKIEANGDDRRCFLYYCSGADGDLENRGWWFGEDIGGEIVFCFARKEGFPPPPAGWCIPDEQEVPVRCMRVTPIQDEARQSPAKKVNTGAREDSHWEDSPWEESRPAKAARAGRPQPPQSAPPPQAVQMSEDSSSGAGRIYEVWMGAGSEHEPLGIRLVTDTVPPLVLEVREGSAAALKGVKPGFELYAVNDQTLIDQESVDAAKQLLWSRPLTLHTKDPGRVQRVTSVADLAPSTPSQGERPLVPPGQGKWKPGW